MKLENNKISETIETLPDIPSVQRSFSTPLNLPVKRKAEAPPIQPPTTWKYMLRAKTLFSLARFNGRFAVLLLAYLICAYLNAFTAVVLPTAIGKIIDAIIFEKSHDEFWQLIESMLTTIFKSILFYALEQVCFNLLQEKITLNIHRKVCSSIVKAKAVHLKDPNLLSNLQEDSKMVCNLATFKLFMQLYVQFHYLKYRITGLLDISQNWTICVLVMHPIFTLIARSADKILSRRIEKLDQLNEKTSKSFRQKIGGMVLTKIHNSAKVIELQKQLEELLLEDDAYKMKKSLLNAILQAITNGLQRLGEIVMLIFGSVLLVQKELTPGNFAVFILKTVNISFAPKVFLRLFDELNKGSGNCKRFFEFIEHAEEAEQESADESDQESSPEIVSKEVTKTQSEKKPTVEDLLKDIEPIPLLQKRPSSIILIKASANQNWWTRKKRHTTLIRVKNEFEDERMASKPKEVEKTTLPVLSESSSTDESDDELAIDKSTDSAKDRKKMQFNAGDEIRFRGTSNR